MNKQQNLDSTMFLVQRDNEILPLMPFLVIFFLSPLYIILPIYIATSTHAILGIIVFLILILGNILLYSLSSYITEIIKQKEIYLSRPAQYFLQIISIFLFISILIIALPGSMAFFALLLSGPPAVITAICSFRYLKKAINSTYLLKKIILKWFCFTMISGALSSFLVSLIPILLIARDGEGLQPALIIGLISMICASISCLFILLSIKVDQYIKHMRLKSLEHK